MPADGFLSPRTANRIAVGSVIAQIKQTGRASAGSLRRLQGNRVPLGEFVGKLTERRPSALFRSLGNVPTAKRQVDSDMIETGLEKGADPPNGRHPKARRMIGSSPPTPKRGFHLA